MRLHDLFVGIEYELLQGTIELEISGISANSKKAKAGDLYFCIIGTRQNGADYLDEIQAANVAAIVTEQPIQVKSQVTVIQVSDIRKVMAQVSCAFYGNPASKLTMIGITGTKGKTTTAFLLSKLLKHAGIKVGLIGTVGITDLHGSYDTSNTTPESYELQKILADMVSQGITTVVMEVSSQGLKMKRVYGITFDYGIYTNLSEDHIGVGEHKDIDEYIFCKKQLMQLSKYSIINVDDRYADDMIEASNQVVTYGYKNTAMYQACNLTMFSEAGVLGVAFDLNDYERIEVGMPGACSLYNALAAICVCELLSLGNATLYQCLKNVAVKGRMECIAVSNAFQCYIDYAHNQASLEQLLVTMRAYAHGHMILVFGCGGNRSRKRRFLMGETAAKLADQTIITNDNPRDENPDLIIEDIVNGFHDKTNYLIIKDRKDAIRYALTHARRGDIVLLAGKGHETYQEICGQKYYMDERMLIREVMEEENVRTICGYNYRYIDRSNG